MREPFFRSLYDPQDYYSVPVTLDPEDVWNVEAGVSVQRPSWRVRGNLFWMNFLNEIVYAGAVDDNGVPVYGNGATSRHRGIEVDGSVTVAHAHEHRRDPVALSQHVHRVSRVRLRGRLGDIRREPHRGIPRRDGVDGCAHGCRARAGRAHAAPRRTLLRRQHRARRSPQRRLHGRGRLSARSAAGIGDGRPGPEAARVRRACQQRLRRALHDLWLRRGGRRRSTSPPRDAISMWG